MKSEMPVSKLVSLRCARCGKLEEIYLRPGSDVPGYYLCSGCKRELEARPKELLGHIGKSVESQHGLGQEER